jgi:hypothetical protein
MAISSSYLQHGAMLMGDGGNESFPRCGGEESAEGGSRSFGAIFGVYEVQLPLESLDNAI